MASLGATGTNRGACARSIKGVACHSIRHNAPENSTEESVTETSATIIDFSAYRAKKRAAGPSRNDGGSPAAYGALVPFYFLWPFLPWMSLHWLDLLPSERKRERFGCYEGRCSGDQTDPFLILYLAGIRSTKGFMALGGQRDGKPASNECCQSTGLKIRGALHPIQIDRRAPQEWSRGLLVQICH